MIERDKIGTQLISNQMHSSTGVEPIHLEYIEKSIVYKLMAQRRLEMREIIVYICKIFYWILHQMSVSSKTRASLYIQRTYRLIYLPTPYRSGAIGPLLSHTRVYGENLRIKIGENMYSWQGFTMSTWSDNMDDPFAEMR